MSEGDNRPTVDIAVPSTDPEKKDEDKPKANGNGKLKDEKDEPEISEEDLQLKAELEMLVERLKESDTGLYLPALESLRTLIRTSTSSMTSVPKPLKFLRPHYDTLGDIRRSWSKDLKEQRALLASILSVLAMTYSDTGKRDTLYYRLISGTHESPGSWGHEYVRHLAAELGEEYNTRFADDEAPGAAPAANGDIKAEETPAAKQEQEQDESREYAVEDLRKLSMELVEFFLKHNAEADAVDLLLEVEDIGSIVEKVDDKTWPRVCQYMVSCVPLLVPPDDRAFLETAAEVYAKHDRYPEALALAVRLYDEDLVRKYYSAPTNRVMQMQLSHFLARAQVPLSWVHTADGDDGATGIDGQQPPMQDDDILDALVHTSLSKHFRNFGKAVGVAEPRSVEDVYKVHLEDSSRGGSATATIDSARQNLAATFVNAFVNAGFGNDKLLVDAPEGSSWIYKNRDAGMTSATASIGLSMLWDPENGVNLVDKYSYSSEETIKAGAIMATGILHAGMRAEPDLAWALLEEHVESQSIPLKIAAFNGIAVSHAGWNRQDISGSVLPYVADDTNEMQVAAMAALCLGFVFVGSGDGEIASTILQNMMERETKQLDSEWTIFMILALALIFVGKQDAAEATIETLHAIEHPIARSAEVLVDACAYAGTGNVLKIQQMLSICSERRDTAKGKKTDDDADPAAPAAAATANGTAAEGTSPDGYAQVPTTDEPMEDTAVAAGGAGGDEQAATAPEEVDMRKQAMATIGIALIAMGEEVGAEMALRQFQHLMTYGDREIRTAVPLALGLISASNPQLSILDTLSKYSHDSDLDVALNSIFAMGLVGAGTNNARLAQMLRQLAVYYSKEADCFFMVRIAQGLVHMGKGTIGLNPFFHDGQIMSRGAMAGLLSTIIALVEPRNFILRDCHWMLYWLSTAMFPQFLITLDEKSQEQAVTVRVGQAVNTVGLAGTRMGISGFQTHQTPVRVATGERAELGTNEYFPYQSVLEGLVILKKNEGYDAEDQ